MSAPPGDSSDERIRLRTTFDATADTYFDARPAYPSALFDAVETICELSPEAHLLEVGCATGTATRPFAERGYRITCVELGAQMAAAARKMLAPWPRVEVLEGAFEETPDAGEQVDLVFAATAWHWVDPQQRYRRAHGLLRPGGHLAIWSATHVFPPGGDPFFRDLQPVYDAIGEGLPPGATFPKPEELPDFGDEIEASGCFELRASIPFDWEVVYDADAYLRLLDTFSGHRAMEPDKRAILDAEIRRRLGGRPDGLLRRHWGARLHVARRKDQIEAAS